MKAPHPATRIILVALIAIAAIWPGAPARPADARPMLVLPVDGGRIVELARISEPNWLPGHRGIDIAAAEGVQVLAPGSGVVAFAGPVAGRPVLAIELDAGVRATLEPVMASVAVGDRVRRGATVGVLAPGQAHCGSRPCLHWGLKIGERYVDPLDWLEGYGRIVLLPRSSATRTRPSTAGSRAASSPLPSGFAIPATLSRPGCGRSAQA